MVSQHPSVDAAAYANFPSVVDLATSPTANAQHIEMVNDTAGADPSSLLTMSVLRVTRADTQNPVQATRRMGFISSGVCGVRLHPHRVLCRDQEVWSQDG
jgi:hypothetical protein